MLENISDKKQLREIRIYSGSQFEGGEGVGQEDEAAAAGHTACTARKQREINADVQLTCSISFRPESQTMESCCPHLDYKSSLQLN